MTKSPEILYVNTTLQRRALQMHLLDHPDLLDFDGMYPSYRVAEVGGPTYDKGFTDAEGFTTRLCGSGKPLSTADKESLKAALRGGNVPGLNANLINTASTYVYTYANIEDSFTVTSERHKLRARVGHFILGWDGGRDQRRNSTVYKVVYFAKIDPGYGDPYRVAVCMKLGRAQSPEPLIYRLRKDRLQENEFIAFDVTKVGASWAHVCTAEDAVHNYYMEFTTMTTT